MDTSRIIILSEKSERERQIPYDIPYMWNLKYEPIYKTDRLIDIGNRLAVVRSSWGGKGRPEVWE